MAKGGPVVKGGMHGKRGCMVKGGHAWQKVGMCMMKGVCMAMGKCGKKGVCMVGGMHSSGHAWWGACMAGKTATAVDSTHPPGMHSCL